MTHTPPGGYPSRRARRREFQPVSRFIARCRVADHAVAASGTEMLPGDCVVAGKARKQVVLPGLMAAWIVDDPVPVAGNMIEHFGGRWREDVHVDGVDLVDELAPVRQLDCCVRLEHDADTPARVRASIAEARLQRLHGVSDRVAVDKVQQQRFMSRHMSTLLPPSTSLFCHEQKSSAALMVIFAGASGLRSVPPRRAGPHPRRWVSTKSLESAAVSKFAVSRRKSG